MCFVCKCHRLFFVIKNCHFCLTPIARYSHDPYILFSIYSAGYLKDTQEVESKELKGVDSSTATKRESFLSDPTQAGEQRHDDVGVGGDGNSQTANEDNDAVPEEFIKYLSEK